MCAPRRVRMLRYGLRSRASVVPCTWPRSTIDVRNNFHTTKEYAAKYMSRKGWQRDRQRNFILNTESPSDELEDLVDDGWTHAVRRMTDVRTAAAQKAAAGQKMSGAELRAASGVVDET